MPCNVNQELQQTGQTIKLPTDPIIDEELPTDICCNCRLCTLTDQPAQGALQHLQKVFLGSLYTAL